MLHYLSVASGNNKISRSSRDFSVSVPDVPSFKSLIHTADQAVAKGSPLGLEEFDRSCGIPDRLLLPKGNSRGMEYVLAVAVTDGEADIQHDLLEKSEAHSHAQCGVHGEKYPDHQPMGFPLDRRIEDERILLGSPNIKYTIVSVTFKG